MDIQLSEMEKIENINYGLRLISRLDGLTYGTDALMLAQFVREHPGKIACDLGSGTGVLSVLMCGMERCERIYAIEIQSEFVSLIERNAQLNGLEKRLISVEADVRTIGVEQVGGKCVDFIICNPPYMKTDSGRPNATKAKNIARHEVCGDIGDFCKAAAKLVKSGGLVYVVYRPDRLSDLMAALRENRLEPKRMQLIAENTESEPSCVLIEAQRDAKTGLKFVPTRFLKEGTC